MTWAPDYAELDDLKAYLGLGSVSLSADADAVLAMCITAASRAIDHETGRQFGKVDAPVPRYYTALDNVHMNNRPALSVVDICSSSGLVVEVDTYGDATFATTLVYGTDFDLWPRNAQADGKPWTHIVLRPTYSAAMWPYGFPYPWGRFSSARDVRVTALYGWSDVPAAVKMACLIQAGRYFVRKDALFGVAGSPQDPGGTVRLLARLDPDVALTLTSVSRDWGAA